MTVLASSSDDILHIGYFISYYRCIVIVLVHDRFHYISIGKLPESYTMQPITAIIIKSLSYANRKINYVTPYGSELCDSRLPQGWYCFVGAAGTKMPTTRVPAYRCGGDWLGWLDDTYPTV